MAFDIWTNFTQGIFEYARSAFSGLEPWLYPLVFVGIIGFVFAAMNSVVVAIVAIIVALGLFATATSIFATVPEITLFFYIVTVVGLGALITSLVVKFGRG